jgi:hypothetical protein
MWRFFTIIVAFATAFYGFSQIPPESSVTNTPSTSGNLLNEEAEEQERIDTIAVSSKKSKEVVREKQTTTRQLKNAPTRSVVNSVEEAPVESASEANGQVSKGVQAAQLSQKAQSFESTRMQSKKQMQQRSPTPVQQMQMNDAVDYFASNAPNSFEYHYFKYVSGNYDISEVAHLREAERLMPSNMDVKVQLAAYHMILNQDDSVQLYLDELSSSGRLAKSAVLYAEDILISAPQNGILITHGFDDTYGVWMNQLKKGIRNDVTLISLDFLQSSAYRKSLKSSGLQLPVGDRIDVNYLSQFCTLNASKSIGISMTTPKNYFLPMKSELYASGLVFEYHSSAYNNFERNEYLWNHAMQKHLVYNANDEKSKQLSANYLPMLLQMRKVYQQRSEQQKVSAMDKAIDQVSIQSRKYKQVQKLKSSY